MDLMNEDEKVHFQMATDNVAMIQNYETESLDREDLIPNFDFHGCASIASKIVSLYNAFKPNNMRLLTTEQNRQISNSAAETINIFNRIALFQPNNSDHVREFANIKEQFRSRLFVVVDQLKTLIALVSALDALFDLETSSSKNKIDFITRDVEALRKELSESLASAKATIETNLASADATLADIKSRAADAAIVGQSTYFSTAADNAKKSSRNWLIATICFSIILAILPIVFICVGKISWLQPSSTYEMVQYWASKLLFFGVVAYFLFQCVKSWNAHRHNYVINQHRHNGLSTFTTLAEAASDIGKRDIILTYAAACIFAPQETGYNKTASSSPPGGQLIEILPKMMSGSQSN